MKIPNFRFSKSLAVPFRVYFCSLNIRGLNQARKRRRVFRWLHDQKFDAAFLQGTYSSKSVEEIWKADWGGKCIIATAPPIQKV